MSVQHNNKNNNNNNKRKNFTGNSKRRYDRRNKRYHSNRNVQKCPLCNRNIHEYFSAISYKKTGVPAHFDCILKEIRAQEELSSNERICYLGNGSFGIITFRNPSSPIKFLIRKRIQYEDLIETPDWRKRLPIKI